MRRARLLSSVGVLELAGIQRFVSLLHVHWLEAASTLGTAAALHWLGVRETGAACAVVHVRHQVDQQSEYCGRERRVRYRLAMVASVQASDGG